MGYGLILCVCYVNDIELSIPRPQRLVDGVAKFIRSYSFLTSLQKFIPSTFTDLNSSNNNDTRNNTKTERMQTRSWQCTQSSPTFRVASPRHYQQILKNHRDYNISIIQSSSRNTSPSSTASENGSSDELSSDCGTDSTLSGKWSCPK